MKKMALIVSGLAALGLLAQVAAAPRPALAPPTGVWQLHIEFHGQPQLLRVRLPGETSVRRFWYIPYTITNNTGQEVRFYPQFDLFTDTFKLQHAGEGVRRPIFEAIRDRYAATLPLLEAESMITGRILLGVDNARDSVAIFEDFDPQATRVSIFVSGLSNENAAVTHPIAVDPETCEPVEILLRKTLQMEYRVIGDELKLDDRVLLYQRHDWIMR